jgi:hypothetical protein
MSGQANGTCLCQRCTAPLLSARERQRRKTATYTADMDLMPQRCRLLLT